MGGYWLFLKTSAVFAEQFNKELMATDFKPKFVVEISHWVSDTILL